MALFSSLKGALGQHFKGHPVIVTFEAGMAGDGGWLPYIDFVKMRFHGDVIVISAELLGSDQANSYVNIIYSTHICMKHHIFHIFHD